MITKYFIGGTFDEGFITHEDQEIQNLRFVSYPPNLTVVTGDDLQIQEWATRNNCTEIDEPTAQKMIAEINASYTDNRTLPAGKDH